MAEMSNTADSIPLGTTCPNGHRVTVPFIREELEKQIKRGDVQLFCIYCDVRWSVSSEERANIAKSLADGTL